jgi:hypothetical protein
MAKTARHMEFRKGRFEASFDVGAKTEGCLGTSGRMMGPWLHKGLLNKVSRLDRRTSADGPAVGFNGRVERGDYRPGYSYLS